MPTRPSRLIGAYATHGATSGSTPSNCSTNRALPSSSNPDAQRRDTRGNAVQLRHMEPARVPLLHAAPTAHRRFLTGCIDWCKNNRADYPISCLGTLIKTGSESIEVTLRGRWLLIAGFVARMEDTRLVVFVRRIGGGRGLRGRAGKRVDALRGRPQSFRHQRRPVDDCSPGQAEIAQDGGTRGGTFHDEMDHCTAEKVRVGLRHAVVRPNVTGRTKDRISQSKRARAGSLVIAD